MTNQTQRIRELNNDLRHHLIGGDYFDRTLTHHSPDPADPAVTERVITIMLADEY